MASILKLPSCQCPTEDDCPRDYDPVCGSDKQTYINPCRLRVEACKTEQSLVVDKKGVCGKAGVFLLFYLSFPLLTMSF